MSAVGTMQNFVSLDGKKPRKPSRDRHPARPDLEHLRSRRLLLTRVFQFARESGDLLLEIGSRWLGRLLISGAAAWPLANLEQEDMLAIVAYLASLDP
jgi:hypothetical protein